MQKLNGLIVIANYNQEQEIESFLRDCLTFLPVDTFVVVDDGSTDRSAEIAEQLGFMVIRQGRNRGVGAALRTGIKLAQERGCDWIMPCSSNGKVVPAEFAKIYGPVIRNEADYTQGSRFLTDGSSPGLPPFRRYAIPVFSLGVSLLLRRWFSDVTCGVRAYRIDFLFKPPVNIDQEWLDRYEMEYYIHYHAVRSKNMRIVEIPVTIRYDHLEKQRHSKIKPFIGWWSMIRPFVFLTLGLKR